ncbi:hypothetical protein N4P33_07880 [Streptomyces sp. 15-116A]|uniref:hypothetical protein n=1 Tax=Streptomyces sp. 15-116A TaxID=2259035 RepID=UPI0021B25DDD|nr:hypothetical protein [Streptomyces sp. 15-116A]MCT7352092.1 hypothetical protein [Streptomyces sp. 15-116A]
MASLTSVVSSGIGARAGRLLLALCACVAVLTTAAPQAQAEPQPRPRAQSQAAYLADRLRTHPVHVTDQLPREVPLSLADDFARVAKRTGVPTYVLVLPGQSAREDGLLAEVHDRLGRDGLYVLIDESEVTEARAHGVRVPAEAAATVVRYELPFDAGPLRAFERFVEVATMAPEDAEKLAAAASEAYGEDGGPADLYIGPADRRNQSFLTGIAVTGVPLSILLLVPYIRRRRRGPPPARGKKKSPAGAPLWRRLLLPTIALLTGAAIAGTAPLVFDQTRSSAAPTPSPQDMSARVERVAAALARDPIYQDPESPQRLSPSQVTRLQARIDRFARSEGGGPVYVTLMPHMPEDETAGDEDRFAAAVHAKLKKDGVYVTADPLSGYIRAFNHGLHVDSYDLLFNVPESIEYGSAKADQAEDHLLGERLDALMTFLDEVPRTEEPRYSGTPLSAPSPAKEHALPPLFATDFWPGLMVGALAALLLLMVVAAMWPVVAKAGRRLGWGPSPDSRDAAPQAPSEAYLRRVARAELRAAAAAVKRTASADDEDANPSAYTRSRNAHDRYEAAKSLAGADTSRLRDPALDPAHLLAIAVLARAARAALDGDSSPRCCAVNPLHGSAVTRQDVRVSPAGKSRRLLPVCEPCRDAAIAAPRELPGRFLTLPCGPDGTARIRYDEASRRLLSPLSKGYGELVTKVKEAAHAG